MYNHWVYLTDNIPQKGHSFNFALEDQSSISGTYTRNDSEERSLRQRLSFAHVLFDVWNWTVLQSIVDWMSSLFRKWNQKVRWQNKQLHEEDYRVKLMLWHAFIQLSSHFCIGHNGLYWCFSKVYRSGRHSLHTIGTTLSQKLLKTDLLWNWYGDSLVLKNHNVKCMCLYLPHILRPKVVYILRWKKGYNSFSKKLSFLIM